MPQGFTWLHLAVPVPAMAYEMNFVFTDGDSYDNNGKKVRREGGESNIEPRDSPNEPQASPPGGFPSAFKRGSPLMKRFPEFTR